MDFNLKIPDTVSAAVCDDLTALVAKASDVPDSEIVYLGIKAVMAIPQEKDGKPGYRVTYPDGYVSWSPKDTFERSYFIPDEILHD